MPSNTPRPSSDFPPLKIWGPQKDTRIGVSLSGKRHAFADGGAPAARILARAREATSSRRRLPRSPPRDSSREPRARPSDPAGTRPPTDRAPCRRVISKTYSASSRRCRARDGSAVDGGGRRGGTRREVRRQMARRARGVAPRPRPPARVRAPRGTTIRGTVRREARDAGGASRRRGGGGRDWVRAGGALREAERAHAASGPSSRGRRGRRGRRSRRHAGGPAWRPSPSTAADASRRTPLPLLERRGRATPGRRREAGDD